VVQNCVRCHARTACLELCAATMALLVSAVRSALNCTHAGCLLHPMPRKASADSACAANSLPQLGAQRAHRADAPCKRLPACFPQQPPRQLCRPKPRQMDLCGMTHELASVCAGLHQGRWSLWGGLPACIFASLQATAHPLAVS